MPTKKLRDGKSKAPMTLSAAMGHGSGEHHAAPVTLLKHNLKSGAGKGKMKGLSTSAGYDTNTKVNISPRKGK